ncbi:hypothetical protein CAPTEDRAFT_188923 [Capitella teleta]|uniref:Macro domain-containing protein n=1 Tax=Capitella teleta TaxID=283909 RepID=R7U4B9_CAPTE|nr:hypothetical protein CAPTEDRAFT_188923 [Capitella teleta]|eukprot:ELU00814.1 hypothetical protein CAPTEDRAFT_188923 [Capitella teleta]
MAAPSFVIFLDVPASIDEMELREKFSEAVSIASYPLTTGAKTVVMGFTCDQAAAAVCSRQVSFGREKLQARKLRPQLFSKCAVDVDLSVLSANGSTQEILDQLKESSGISCDVSTGQSIKLCGDLAQLVQASFMLHDMRQHQKISITKEAITDPIHSKTNHSFGDECTMVFSQNNDDKDKVFEGSNFESVETYKIDDFTIVTKTGNVTDEDVDVIVCPATKDLRISQNYGVVEASRSGHVDLVHSSFLRRCPLKFSDVVSIPFKGEFKCGHIVYAVGPVYQDYEDDETCGQDLCSTFLKVLIEANDLLKASSLAVPAISTGGNLVPLDICARSFTEAVQKFCLLRVQRHLKKVFLVNNDPQTTYLFDVIIGEMLEQGKEGNQKTEQARQAQANESSNSDTFMADFQFQEHDEEDVVSAEHYSWFFYWLSMFLCCVFGIYFLSIVPNFVETFLSLKNKDKELLLYLDYVGATLCDY